MISVANTNGTTTAVTTAPDGFTTAPSSPAGMVMGNPDWDYSKAEEELWEIIINGRKFLESLEMFAKAKFPKGNSFNSTVTGKKHGDGGGDDNGDDDVGNGNNITASDEQGGGTAANNETENDNETDEKNGSKRKKRKIAKRHGSGSIIHICAKSGRQKGVYDSIKDASEHLATAEHMPGKVLLYRGISQVLAGKQNHFRGCYFRYAIDERPLPKFPIKMSKQAKKFCSAKIPPPPPHTRMIENAMTNAAAANIMRKNLGTAAAAASTRTVPTAHEGLISSWIRQKAVVVKHPTTGGTTQQNAAAAATTKASGDDTSEGENIRQQQQRTDQISKILAGHRGFPGPIMFESTSTDSKKPDQTTTTPTAQEEEEQNDDNDELKKRKRTAS